MFIGTCFAGTAKTTVNYINPDPLYDTVTLKNIWADEIWARTIPIETSKVDWNNLPKWDYYTWMRASYKKSPHAGNIEYKVDEVMYIKLKRRLAESTPSNWQTIYTKNIGSKDDFNFDIMDYLEPSNTMIEYLYVAVGYNEGEFPHDESKGTRVLSKFDNYFIIDMDKSYPAIIEASTVPKMNVPVEIIEAFGSRYPFVIRKGLTRYRTGTMVASYIEMNCCEDSDPKTHWEYNTETGRYYEAAPSSVLDMDNAWKYRNEVEDFISNGHAKLIKSMEGDLWLVSMTSAPAREKGGDYRHITTSFDWAEIGDPFNARDLYNAGLISTDVDAEVGL